MEELKKELKEYKEYKKKIQLRIKLLQKQNTLIFNIRSKDDLQEAYNICTGGFYVTLLSIILVLIVMSWLVIYYGDTSYFALFFVVFICISVMYFLSGRRKALKHRYENICKVIEENSEFEEMETGLKLRDPKEYFEDMETTSFSDLKEENELLLN
jgi:Flp pilus assembly protein TadB